MMTARLTDLIPAIKRAETVDILGHPVECRPLTLIDLAQLLLRFRGVLRLTRDGENEMTLRIDADAITTAGPEALAAVLAAGTGTPGDAEQEAAAADLPPGVQARLFAVILRLSAPEGIIPFVNDLVALVGAQLSPEAAAQMNGLARAA